MNELIERLAREAGFIEQRSEPTKDFPDGVAFLAAYHYQVEAFAKLVARECAEIANHTTAYTQFQSIENYKFTAAAVKAIRERFGITESTKPNE